MTDVRSRDHHPRLPVDDGPLLAAMLRLLIRRGVNAVVVSGYQERSYNLGRCVTCSEMVTEVRIHYLKSSGGPGHWHYSGDLRKLICALTDDETERSSLEDVAVRETEDERWDRAYVLSFDQTPDDDG